MTIGNFYARAQAAEFARDFQFQVINLGPFTEDDLLYLQTVSLPAQTIQNQTATYMGLDFNIPGSVKFDGSNSWSVTMWCDEGLNIRNKMEAYIKAVWDIDTSTGLYGVPEEVATLDLKDKQRQTLRTYKFYGLYPVTVGAINYDIKGTGAILNVDLTFAYQYWELQ